VEIDEIPFGPLWKGGYTNPEPKISSVASSLITTPFEKFCLRFKASQSKPCTFYTAISPIPQKRFSPQNNRFITTLKKMPGTFVPKIEVLRNKAKGKSNGSSCAV
jgi:hypothetical protein